MGRLIVALVILLGSFACGPKCVKEESKRVWIPPHDELENIYGMPYPFNPGNMPMGHIPVNKHYDGKWVERFVCVEWEKQDGKTNNVQGSTGKWKIDVEF